MNGIFLVARREYLAYVGAWGFWISLLTTPLLLAMIMAAPLLLGEAEPTRYMTIVSDREEARSAIVKAFDDDARADVRGAFYAYANRAAPAAANEALAAFDIAPDRAAAIEAGRSVLERASPGAGARFVVPPARYEFVLAPAPDIEGLKPFLSGAQTTGNGPLFAAFEVRGRGGDLTLNYWSTNLTDDSPLNRARAALRQLMLRDALAQYGLGLRDAERLQALSPGVAQFDPRPAAPAGEVTDQDRAPYLIAIGLSLLLWSAIFGIANMLLTGVLEEKSNKILDALLTSVSPLQILIGKLAGVAAVSATLFTVWGLVGGFALSQVAALPENPVAPFARAALEPSVAITFLVCFAAGYLLYGAIFLGLGALCDSLQEAQTLLGPVFFVLVGPLLLFAPALLNPKSPIVVGASWIPPFTPFVMMMRAPAGLTFAEAAGPVALLLVTIVVVLFLASRLFRAGVSHQLKIADVFKRFGRKAA